VSREGAQGFFSNNPFIGALIVLQNYMRILHICIVVFHGLDRFFTMFSDKHFLHDGMTIP